MKSEIKYLFLSLDQPAKLNLGMSEWDMESQVFIQGLPVEGNDTPWLSFADLLVDRDEANFVGLTFLIDNEVFWEPMRLLAQSLDPEVIRYNDISTSDAKSMYPGEAGKYRRFEITWAPARTLECEIAQLCCGQWFWWYSKIGSSSLSTHLIALGITDIDDLIAEHNLKFPKNLDFPPLEVEFS